MRLFENIYNRFLIPGFLINGLPKAGTNLLTKTVTLFPGIRPMNLNIHHGTVEQFGRVGVGQIATVPIGIDWPQLAPFDAIHSALQGVKNGTYVAGHIRFSDELADMLVELEMKTLLILRDPRDVVVSHASYIARTRDHFLFELYQTLSESERIMKSIVGVKQITSEGPMLLDVYERFQLVFPWVLQPFNYTTSFERLVGPQGGGMSDAQLVEIKNIANHLGIKYNLHDIEQIAQQLFGGTATFRKGQIGNWRSNLTTEHKDALKELVGQLLIDLGYEQDKNW